MVLKIERRIYRIAGQQMFWRERCDSVFVVFWLMCCVRRIIDNLPLNLLPANLTAAGRNYKLR